MSKDFLKYINRLPEKEKIKFFKLIETIEKLELDNLDLKKLKGFSDRYRIRVGKIRIVFEIKNNKGIIYEINTRGDIYYPTSFS